MSIALSPLLRDTATPSPNEGFWTALSRVTVALYESPAYDFKTMLAQADIPLSEVAGKDWSGISFVGDDLRDIDFSGCDLRGADFQNADITGCWFHEALVEEGAFDFAVGHTHASFDVSRDLVGHSRAVLGAFETSSGLLVSWADDQSVRLWSRTGSVIAVLKGHTSEIQAVDELPNGSLMSWTASDIRVWTATGMLQGVAKRDKKVENIEVLSNGGIVVETEDEIQLSHRPLIQPSWTAAKNYHRWYRKVDNGEVLIGEGNHFSRRNIDGHVLARYDLANVVGAVELLDRRILACGRSKGFRGSTDMAVWDAYGSVKRDLFGHIGDVLVVEVFRSGGFLTIGADSATSWNAGGELVSQTEFEDFSALRVTALSSGLWLIVCSDANWRLLDECGELVSVMDVDDNNQEVTELPDGRLFSWSQTCIQLWTSRGELIERADGYWPQRNIIVLRNGGLLAWSGRFLTLTKSI